MDKKTAVIWEIPNIPENTFVFETAIDWEKEEKEIEMSAPKSSDHVVDRRLSCGNESCNNLAR